MDNKKQAILDSLIYSDIFSFPLTLSEIKRYSALRDLPAATYRRILASLYPVVKERNGYYYLVGRDRIVPKRRRGVPHARAKYQEARRVAQILSYIPTVRFIGLSGTVATGSAKRTDDIDFFLVTQRSTLFLTRFVVLVVLSLLGRRRSRSDTHGTNKICLNMLLDETKLRFPPSRHDLYTAREIVQLVPLFSRSKTYQRLLTSNTWIKSFFPTATPQSLPMPDKTVLKGITYGWYLLCFPLEWFCRTVQLQMMKRHQTSETVTHAYLAFHPRDYRLQTLATYEKNRQYYYVLLQRKHTRIRVPSDIDKEKNIFYTA